MFYLIHFNPFKMTPEPNYIFYYVLSGLLGMALCTIIWNYFHKLDKIVTMLTEQIASIKMDQAVMKKEIESTKERTVKMEDNLADEIVNKLRAITPKR